MLPLTLQVITVTKLILATGFWVFILAVIELEVPKYLYVALCLNFKKRRRRKHLRAPHPLTRGIDKQKFQVVRFLEFYETGNEKPMGVSKRFNFLKSIGSKDLPPVVVNNVFKYYGKKLALRDITFFVDVGECFGILGAEGSGKTTLLEIITQQVELSNGTVLLNSINIKEKKNMVRFAWKL